MLAMNEAGVLESQEGGDLPEIRSDVVEEQYIRITIRPRKSLVCLYPRVPPRSSTSIQSEVLLVSLMAILGGG
jgi:hypothetical protein